jgi:hypothetical protein
MRRFKWRLFERKGKRKEANKDERLLQQNVEDIKKEILNKGGVKNLREVAKELLTEED